MENFRKIILRIHGTFLIIAGIANGINITVGLLYQKGPFYYIQTNKLAFIGLIQAYILASLIGSVLWLGSYQEQRRKWNVIGLLFHTLMLIGYSFMGSYFATIPSGQEMLKGGLIFHISFSLLEASAVFISKKSTGSSKS